MSADVLSTRTDLNLEPKKPTTVSKPKLSSTRSEMQMPRKESQPIATPPVTPGHRNISMRRPNTHKKPKIPSGLSKSKQLQLQNEQILNNLVESGQVPPGSKIIFRSLTEGIVKVQTPEGDVLTFKLGKGKTSYIGKNVHVEKVAGKYVKAGTTEETYYVDTKTGKKYYLIPGEGYVSEEDYEKYKKLKEKKKVEIDQYSSQELAAQAPPMSQVAIEAEYQALQEEAKRKGTSVEVLLRDKLVQEFKEKYGIDRPLTAEEYAFIYDAVQARLKLYHAAEKGYIPTSGQAQFATDFKSWLPEPEIKYPSEYEQKKAWYSAKQLESLLFAGKLTKESLLESLPEVTELPKYVEPYLWENRPKVYHPQGFAGEMFKKAEEIKEEAIKYGVPEPIAEFGVLGSKYAAGVVGSFEAWRELSPNQPNVADIGGALIGSVSESFSEEAKQSLEEIIGFGSFGKPQGLPALGYTAFGGFVGWSIYAAPKIPTILGGFYPKLSPEAEWLLQHPAYAYGGLSGEFLQAWLGDIASEKVGKIIGKGLEKAGKEYTEALKQEIKFEKTFPEGVEQPGFGQWLSEYTIPKWKRRILEPFAAMNDARKIMQEAMTEVKTKPKITVPEKVTLEEIGIGDALKIRYGFEGEKDITEIWKMGSPAPKAGTLKVKGPIIGEGLSLEHEMKLPYSPWKTTLYLEGEEVKTYGLLTKEGGEFLVKGAEKTPGVSYLKTQFEISYPWEGIKTTPMKDLTKVGFDLASSEGFKAKPTLAEQIGDLALDLLQTPKVVWTEYILPQFSLETYVVSKKLPKIVPPSISHATYVLTKESELKPVSSKYQVWEVLPELERPPELVWGLKHDLLRIKLEYGATKKMPSLSTAIGYHFSEETTKATKNISVFDISDKSVSLVKKTSRIRKFERRANILANTSFLENTSSKRKHLFKIVPKLGIGTKAASNIKFRLELSPSLKSRLFTSTTTVGIPSFSEPIIPKTSPIPVIPSISFSGGIGNKLLSRRRRLRYWTNPYPKPLQILGIKILMKIKQKKKVKRRHKSSRSKKKKRR